MFIIRDNPTLLHEKNTVKKHCSISFDNEKNENSNYTLSHNQVFYFLVYDFRELQIHLTWCESVALANYWILL